MLHKPFRQIHLDFHTSPDIPDIGADFNKEQWQERLKLAHVNSITCFSSCHHGMSYHPTKVGKMHPNLKFNLLRAQIDACHEIGVQVPIYLTGGVNNYAAETHPEWREINPKGELAAWVQSPLEPGFKKLCFNSPYLDYLCAMLEESAKMFPDADGIFIDIISQGQCCCEYCMRDMVKEGYDPESEKDRIRFSKRTLLKYYQRATAACRCLNPNLPVFHNSGNIQEGASDILPYFSHLELESLPTGGWGYDHFPMSIAYTRNLGLDVTGMTGKFHTTWGEFGGFKHPNALRYECAAMLANGSKCNIGSQLHPSAEPDLSACELIGKAYKEVEEKETWCDNVVSLADTAILSNQANDILSKDGKPSEQAKNSETGCARLLLESHIFFDIIDQNMDFCKYKYLILADTIQLSETLKQKIEQFLSRGGKLIASGISLLFKNQFVFPELVSDYQGLAPEFPDYILPSREVAPSFVHTPFVMYQPSNRIIPADGTYSLGQIQAPYFARTWKHFCSHQHTPYKKEISGFSAGVMNHNILYFAHPIFELYAAYGAVALKEFIVNSIRKFTDNDFIIRTNLPSQGRVTLMYQAEAKRSILHLLYVNTITRGSKMELSGGNCRASQKIEVIEELNPYYQVKAEVKISHSVSKITLEPQGIELPIKREKDRYLVTLDKLVCHQMVVFQ
ncbi:MAG: alpha-amylase family protein [Lentisphaeria bacterium]